ncbi:MAG: sel1 repeat family protein, partial [Acidobacteriia bacterium]|nr:sel1 repeat family protein [Terriglobia bacterium]
AENGIVLAAAALGDIYYSGDGIARDYAEAEKWYRKAAEQGIASAEFGLGIMYDLGQGVPQDYKQAMEWYTKAAEASYAPAMTNLGILYYNAQGEKRDLIQAYAWMARGQKLGDLRSAELVKTTGERMSPKDVKRAQVLVDQWQPSSKAAEMDASSLFRRPETAPATGSAQGEASRQDLTQPVADPGSR